MLNNKPISRQYIFAVRSIIIALTILFNFSNRSKAQNRTLSGRIISEDLDTLPYVEIYNSDHVFLGKADIGGRFKINISAKTRTLIFSFLGVEATTVKLNDNCDTIDVVMMWLGTYDFISPRKVDRLRLKRFQNIPNIHLQAYRKGLFLTPTACYWEDFRPDKPALDSIGVVMTRVYKQNKMDFKKLNPGDTVKIRFSGVYRYDGTDTTTLFPYAVSKNNFKYKYAVKARVISKNTRKRGYNLMLKIISCELGDHPAVYRDTIMQVGQVFNYNMKYCDVMLE